MKQVNLTYFKPNGKYYSEGSYMTSRNGLYEVWEEVTQMGRAGTLPGLIQGCTEFVVSVDAPDHEHNHPHLINTDGEWK